MLLVIRLRESEKTFLSPTHSTQNKIPLKKHYLWRRKKKEWMNTIFIVLPILSILMFEIGLALKLEDFRLIKTEKKSVLAGLIGQLLILPLIAFALGIVFKLDALYFIGLLLIACSPGGSSSNIFTLVAKGNVALSVILTALSSVLTFVSLPVIMLLVTKFVNNNTGNIIELPIGKLILQNIVLTIVPILLGVLFKKCKPQATLKLDSILSKIAFPALLLLVAVFFIQHKETIVAEFTNLGVVTTALIALTMLSGHALSKIFKLGNKNRKTIVIEVGMQNAAQAITIASSPLIFDNELMAIPAIIYALIMNVLLLCYIKWLRK